MLALGVGVWAASVLQPVSSKELESIMLNGFNEFTRGVHLICFIPLLCKQLLSDTRRLR